MPESQHQQPKDIQLYHKGVNADDDQEILAASEKGWAVDSQNARPTKVNNHSGAVSKIKGEELLYPNLDNRCSLAPGPFTAIPGNYYCIGQATVINHIVEFWAEESTTQGTTPLLPLIRIDGWVVCQAITFARFPLLKEFPLQLSPNDSCVGGEICVTDNNIAPFVLNIGDMLTNSGIDPETKQRDTVKYPCTLKYFDDFDISKFQVQLNRPVDHPIFVELSVGTSSNIIGRKETAGANTGMQPGAYQYAVRYSSAAGDVALFSEATPVIPVPLGLGTASNQFPGSRTYGARPTTTPTPYSVHIRFRVSNILDYDQIEVMRVSWINGKAIGDIGVEEVVAIINITPQEFSIIDFFDTDNTAVATLPPEVSTDTLSSIEKAKAIRYYNSRLFLMNITYESKAVDGKVTWDTFSSGAEMIPISSQLKAIGYKDIWNNVYKKSYFRGERGGFASVFFDSNGARSFALEVPNQGNVLMPERRDELTGDSLIYSNVKGFVDPTNEQVKTQQTGGSIGKTFEVFDLVDAVDKPIIGEDTPANVSNPGAGHSYIYNILNAGSKGGTTSPPPYGVYHPSSNQDPSTLSHTTNTNPEVKTDSTTVVPYQPKGFAPNIYALGMEMAGIKTMPPWVKAFSIVRTEAAGRVIAQGQTFWNMDDLAPKVDIEKNLNRVYWQSPDTYAGIVSFPLQIQPRISAGTLKAKFVSAMGFFSELYSGKHRSAILFNTVCTGMDIAHYCRVLEDHGSINIDAGSGAISVLGIQQGANKYVSFGSWRNAVASPTTPGIAHSSFTMASDGRGGAHRGRPYYIDVPAGIYSTQGTSGGDIYRDPGVRNWHEPVYAVNLIDDNVTPPVSNITEYFETGTYVKVESILTISDGITQDYYLVDERWEDCIPALRASFLPQANDDRFIYLRDSANNEQAWINVTYKTLAFKNTVNADILNNGFYISVRPDSTIVKVYGMYTHTNTNINGVSPVGAQTSDPAYYRLFQISFDQVDSTGFPYIPLAGLQILVRYDHFAPVDVFGGDTFIGEFVYSPVDAQYDDKAKPVGGNNGPNDVSFDRPMPYHEFRGDEQHLVIRSTQPTFGNRIQDNNIFKLKDAAISLVHGRVRQQLVSGIVESRVNTSLGLFGYKSSFVEGQFQEDVSYIMRPYEWNLDQNGNTEDSKIYPAYYTDYPNEATTFWGYGGFRFLPAANADYSEISNKRHFSRPKAGFTEETHFCSEVIWSQKRPTNRSFAPGLLTFPPLNLYEVGDETGAIKFAWDGLAGSGTNLYAITEHGVAMLLTEKRILTELSGAQLAAVGSSETTVVQEVVWLSKSIGMNDEWWRSKAEWNNALYFTNRNSAYRLAGNELADIGRDLPGSKYFTRLLPLIDSVGKGYTTDVTAAYDVLNKEYWTSIAKHRTRIGFFQPPLFANIYVYFVKTIPPPAPATTPISFIATQGQIFSVLNDQISFIDIRLLTDFSSIAEQNIFIVNDQTTPITIYHDPTLGNPTIGLAVSLVVIQPGETYEILRNDPPLPSTGIWHARLVTLPGASIPVWSEKTGGSWIGQFKFNFDRFTTIDNRIYAARFVETWELNKGYLMNGAPIEMWTLQATVGGAENLNKSKEFIRTRIAGSPEPQRVDFYDNIEQFDANAPTGTLNIITNPQFSLKDYGAYEQYVPRKTAAPRFRQQGRLMLFKIMHNLQSAFKIIDTAITYKNLK